MTDYAYLAGIVDGEGTITIHRHRQHNRDSYQLRPRLIVANNHRGLLDALAERHGGSVISQPIPRGVRRSPSFIWRVCSTDDILRLARAMRPHLIVKAAQADIMIAYLESRLTARIAARRAGPYTDENLASYEAIRALNDREVKLCA